jgi:hypothetical protein
MLRPIAMVDNVITESMEKVEDLEDLMMMQLGGKTRTARCGQLRGYKVSFYSTVSLRLRTAITASALSLSRDLHHLHEDLEFWKRRLITCHSTRRVVLG